MYYTIKKQGSLSTLLLCFVFSLNILNAQINLVPNPSLEQYTICPQGYLHEKADFWYHPDKGGGGVLECLQGRK